MGTKSKPPARGKSAAASYGAAISARLDALATISSEPGMLTRLYLTEAHKQAAERVLQWMREAGMTARIDAIGNVVGHYAGETPGAPVLLLGSHIDTVRDAGKYDGTLGVVAAIAVVATLHITGRRLPFAIEVVAFGDEEGVRFPTTLGGSRALAGLFDRKTLDEKDADGISRRQALIDFGCDPSQIGKDARNPKRVLGYVELHITGRRLPFAIEVVAFGDEEGVRFPTTLGGSRALAGVFDKKALAETDSDGISRRQALIDFGCDPSQIGKDARNPKRVLGYVELHIEQGPVLEAEDCPVAVVTAINGATRGTVTIRGESGHAGTVPMALRRDALAAAAEMVLAVEGRAAGEADLVATVGRLEVGNPAANTVPGQVSLTLDIRSPSDAARTRAVTDITQRIKAIAAARRVAANVAFGYDAPAAACDPRLSQALARAIAAEGLQVRQMPSGAGHDAMAFRDRIPFAMLFVRCREGISHNPAEYASPGDIDVAARVLETFLLSLSA